MGSKAPGEGSKERLKEARTGQGVTRSTGPPSHLLEQGTEHAVGNTGLRGLTPAPALLAN